MPVNIVPLPVSFSWSFFIILLYLHTTLEILSLDSRDWHHAGKDRSLLCTECRLYFKKYGELRLLAADKSDSLPEFLFKPVREEVEINLESDDRKSFIDGSRVRIRLLSLTLSKLLAFRI